MSCVDVARTGKIVVIDKVAKSVNFGPNFSFPLFVKLSNVTSTRKYNHEAPITKVPESCGGW